MLSIETNDKMTAENLHEDIKNVTAEQVEIFEKRNLSGAEATWIVAANLAIEALSKILPLLLNAIKDNRVKSISIDGDIIENPTNEQVEILLKQRQQSETSS